MSDKKPVTYLSDRKYSETHEWVKVEGDPSAGSGQVVAVIGISDYAQDALGDLVFVELPKVGAKFDAGKAFGVVESVKAASDLFAPISGEVVAINAAVADKAEMVNADAFGAGWLIKLRVANPAELQKLLDAETYRKKIEAGEIH